MHTASYAALALSALPAVHAWGALGHMTVGFVAQNFLQPQSVTWAQNILGIKNSSYLASVAPWADSYRYTSEGHWSAPLHFIDAHDSPPTTCDVDFNRDCGDTGCSVSAIANYTQRVQDKSLDSTQTKEALEFLVHFFGDVTQPLHDEAEEVGGNDISVTFGSEQTNLHAIWDTNMLEKYVGGYELSDAQKWAQNLSTEIKSGQYASVAGSWIADMNLGDAQGTALKFASDANTFVCSYVLKGGDSAVEGKDLSGAYYEAAIPVFTQQIAKAGYRLAAWINLLATGQPGVSGGNGTSQFISRRDMIFKEQHRPWDRFCGA